jgi:hypothetical protein
VVASSRCISAGTAAWRAKGGRRDRIAEPQDHEAKRGQRGRIELPYKCSQDVAD